MGTRTWFKVYAKQWLEGSFLNVKMDIKGAWISLLAVHSMTESDEHSILSATFSATSYTKNGRTNDIFGTKRTKNGSQSGSFGMGYTDTQLAKMMHLSYRKWIRYKAYFVSHGMIEVLPNNVIKINNWSKYQSEYRRQKGYRPKLQPKVTTSEGSQSYPKVTLEKEKEKENKDFIGTSVPKYLERHGQPVPRDAEYHCDICSDQANKPISHKYSEIERGTCKTI